MNSSQIIVRRTTTPSLSDGGLDFANGSKAGSHFVHSCIRHKRMITLTAGATYSLAASGADLAEGACDAILVDASCGVFSQDPESPYMVRNGDFAASTGWTGFNTDWVINTTAGTATHAAGNTTDLTQTLDGSWATGATAIKTSRDHAVVFTVSGRSAGSVTAYIGTTAGTARSTNATFVEVINAQSQVLKFTPSSDFDGAVSVVGVYPLSWTLNANEPTPLSAIKIIGVKSASANLWALYYRMPGATNLG